MQAKRHFWLQGGLIVKFAIVWSGFQHSVAVKTKWRKLGGRAAHVSYPQGVSAPPPLPGGPKVGQKGKGKGKGVPLIP